MVSLAPLSRNADTVLAEESRWMVRFLGLPKPWFIKILSTVNKCNFRGCMLGEQSVDSLISPTYSLKGFFKMYAYCVFAQLFGNAKC